MARLLKTLHEFALILDSNGIIQNLWSSNRSHLRPIENALLGRRLQDLVNDQMVGWIARMMQDAIASGQGICELQPVALADGEHSFSVSVMPMAAKPGGPKTMCLLARDLTPWKASREALIVRESLLAQAEELANVGSWEVDFENRTLNWSAHFYRMLGLPPERGPVMFGRGIEMIHPDDRERGTRDAEALRKDGKPFENELRFLTAHRGVRIFHSRAIALRDGNGRIVRIRGMSQDVTERREAEEKLREREALLAQVEQIANFGSWQTDLAAQKSTASPNMSKIVGVSPDAKVSPSHYWERIHPEDLARAREITNRATEQGTLFEYETRFLPPEGGVRFLHVRGTAILDAAGKPLRRVGVVQDITERREAEEKLREREVLFTYGEEIANFGSWQYEFATDQLTLSPNLKKILAFGSGEPWSGDVYWERVHAEDRPKARAIVEKATRERVPFEYVARYLPPEGGVRFVHIRGVPLLDAEGKLVRRVGVSQDITEQVRAEEELRRLSQQLLRARDDDRRHIARELHESAGQSLAALKMTLGRLRDALDESTDSARALLRSAVELADAAVREVRTVSYLMHPPMLDEAGLAPALRWYARGFAERSGIQVQVDVPENMPRQSQEIETTIFRIVQEALTNVHRYSGSRTAQIRIACHNGDICAEVRDEGCGLPPPRRSWGAAEAFGVGIAGMRERVKQLDGAFVLESAPGVGTTVRVTLPTEAKAAECVLETDEEFIADTETKGKARPHGA